MAVTVAEMSQHDREVGGRARRHRRVVPRAGAGVRVQRGVLAARRVDAGAARIRQVARPVPLHRQRGTYLRPRPDGAPPGGRHRLGVARVRGRVPVAHVPTVARRTHLPEDALPRRRAVEHRRVPRGGRHHPRRRPVGGVARRAALCAAVLRRGTWHRVRVDGRGVPAPGASRTCTSRSGTCWARCSGSRGSTSSRSS